MWNCRAGGHRKGRLFQPSAMQECLDSRADTTGSAECSMLTVCVWLPYRRRHLWGWRKEGGTLLQPGLGPIAGAGWGASMPAESFCIARLNSTPLTHQILPGWLVPGSERSAPFWENLCSLCERLTSPSVEIWQPLHLPALAGFPCHLCRRLGPALRTCLAQPEGSGELGPAAPR